MTSSKEEKGMGFTKDGHYDFTRKEVGESEFEGSNIKYLHFGPEVSKIGISAFKKSRLTEVTFDPKSQLEIIDDFAFDRCELLKHMTLPPSVTRLGNSSFKNSGLESIALSAELLEIGPMAFIGCELLKEVSIPYKVTSIGVSAFEDCTNLKTIILPESLIKIGKYAFEDCCNLKYIVIDSKTDADFERIKNLLPPNLGNKTMPMNKYTQLQVFKDLVMGATVKFSPETAFEDESPLYRFFSAEAKRNGQEMIEPELLKEIVKFI